MANLSASIKTPIGTLLFSAGASEGDLSSASITTCEVKAIIPEAMRVQECIAVLLRCTSSSPLRGVVFSCEWSESRGAGYGATGEGLDAWEWESDGVLVMVGTEDAEWLNSRLRLLKKFGSHNYPITNANNKISIVVEEFLAHQEFSLHFVVAWNQLPEPKECSCWYAVDVPHKRIVELCR